MKLVRVTLVLSVPDDEFLVDVEEAIEQALIDSELDEYDLDDLYAEGVE